jgi:hypothetical protein
VEKMKKIITLAVLALASNFAVANDVPEPHYTPVMVDNYPTITYSQDLKGISEGGSTAGVDDEITNAKIGEMLITAIIVASIIILVSE